METPMSFQSRLGPTDRGQRPGAPAVAGVPVQRKHAGTFRDLRRRPAHALQVLPVGTVAIDAYTFDQVSRPRGGLQVVPARQALQPIVEQLAGGVRRPLLASSHRSLPRASLPWSRPAQCLLELDALAQELLSLAHVRILGQLEQP